jgi:hypothetical protein
MSASASTARPEDANRSETVRRTAHVGARVAASILGGYVFCFGFVTLGTVLGASCGMPYEEAQTLVHLLVFLVFVGAFCWAFVDRSLLRVWAVLGLGGAVMTALGWGLGRTLT